MKHGVKEFKIFEEKESHVIKLTDGAETMKDHYYPISPAVQEITYRELDTMLNLKFI